MRIKSITSKLFILTFLFFLILLGSIVGVQGFLFDKLYLKKKNESMQRNLISFSQEYLNSDWSSIMAERKFHSFSEKNNANLLMIDEYGKVMFQDESEQYAITIKDDHGNAFDINMEITRYLEAFSPLNLKLGDDIYVDGFISTEKSNTVFPVKIKWAGNEYFDSKLLQKYEGGANRNTVTHNITGKIISIKNAKKHSSYENFRRDLLWNKSYEYWLNSQSAIPDYNKIQTMFIDSESGFKNVMFVKRLKKDSNEAYLFSIISLQPIDEASFILNYYIFYIILLAVVLILILSTIYSRIIAKPLIKLNSTAKRMAKLDFSSPSTVKSDDELGSLSQSLNTLAHSLQTAMMNLKKANDKLLLDINKERELEKSRKQFVADISHELKTPLGIIRGYAEGIKFDIYKEKKDQYADVIIAETEKMDDLVLDMLELSNLESKAYRINKRTFDLNRLVSNVTQRFKHSIEQKGLTIQISISKTLVHADESKIEQVYKNLLSNAIKYTDKDGFILIQNKQSFDETIVEIENFRTPLSRDELNKIWDRFYRCDKSRNRSFGGTGLGLSIVKNILDLHESTYGIRNTPNGVEFYFSLKLDESALAVPKKHK